MLYALCLLILPETTCGPDETIHAYGAGERRFILSTLDGTPFDARATIEFPEPGQMAGDGPCNRFTTEQRVPYPWFESGPIAATRRGCPDLAAESHYFEALGDMTLGFVEGDQLILTNDRGREMVFTELPSGTASE